MADLTLGNKLYSYCYGPMTIVEIRSEYYIVKADDYDGMMDAVKTIEDAHIESPSLNGTHWFYKSSVGETIFTNPKDATSKNVIKAEWLHAYYGGKQPTATVGESAVSVVFAKKEESSVTVVDDATRFTGESPITVI